METICLLIEDDIRYTRLVNGLRMAGFETTDFIPHTSDVIFTLMGLGEHNTPEHIYRTYFDLIASYSENDCPRSAAELSLQLYQFLETSKQLVK